MVILGILAILRGHQSFPCLPSSAGRLLCPATNRSTRLKPTNRSVLVSCRNQAQARDKPDLESNSTPNLMSLLCAVKWAQVAGNSRGNNSRLRSRRREMCRGTSSATARHLSTRTTLRKGVRNSSCLEQATWNDFPRPRVTSRECRK